MCCFQSGRSRLKARVKNGTSLNKRRLQQQHPSFKCSLCARRLLVAKMRITKTSDGGLGAGMFRKWLKGVSGLCLDSCGGNADK